MLVCRDVAKAVVGGGRGTNAAVPRGRDEEQNVPDHVSESAHRARVLPGHLWWYDRRRPQAHSEPSIIRVTRVCGQHT